MRRNHIIILLVFLLCSFQNLSAQSRILDAFDSLSGWQTVASDQVQIQTQLVEGYSGTCIRIDFDFSSGAGYGGIQKILPVELPENYQFSFYLKGEAPSNNLEFKLLDGSGENVWWLNQRNFDFPEEWKKITIKKRHISFAWGPVTDKALRKVERIEFIIASSSGGKGTIHLDQLVFEPLDVPDANPPEPACEVSSTQDKKHSGQNIFDRNPQTSWYSKKKPESQFLLVDLKKYRELGGLIIDWDSLDYAREYEIQVSNDKKEWTSAYQVHTGKGGRSYIYLKDFDSRFIKINLMKSSRSSGYAIKDLEIKNFEFSQSKESFFSVIASQKPRGHFPRYFHDEQSYWTVVGVNDDQDEALINEEGMIEVDKNCFSIEPFVFQQGKLTTWNEVQLKQSLEQEYLPIPTVEWSHPDFRLLIQTFAAGAVDSSILFIRYQFINTGVDNFSGHLFLAIRPFQVNSTWQFLNNPGGVVRVESIHFLRDSQKIQVNQNKTICVLSRADDFGAVTFDEGDITDYLVNNQLPKHQTVVDHFGHAAGALRYKIEVSAGSSQEIFLAVPFHEKYEQFPEFPDSHSVSNFYLQKFTEISDYWELKVARVRFNVPPPAQPIINSIRSNLAYILINRDGPGIQPGSRSYERSWIRDGSLTSSALLKMGIQPEVKEFVEWYSTFQAADGKVPCVVDRRGPDPVPENDSHGQLIFAIMQYFQFTRDTTFLREQYLHIRLAVNYLEFLMNQRLTDYFKNGNDSLQSLYGLLPESISHEGYSDKPRHSYWDNFFALKGLKDAIAAAQILGEEADKERFIDLRDNFQKNLYHSIALAITRTGIDYIPGCAELGDFDATSTTIALSPCNELNNLPQPFGQNTFDRYFTYFTDRLDPSFNWKDYTPYEVRLIGSFIFLNQAERAHQLLSFFFNDQRPNGWNQWTEVVRKGYRTPGFIGDLPHTWVGSDFINAARSFFVYEDESTQSLVIGAGLKNTWFDFPAGIEVNNLPTYYGDLDYSIFKKENNYHIKIWGAVSIPAGQFKLKNFWGESLKSVTVNGQKSTKYDLDYIYFSEFPAELIIE